MKHLFIVLALSAAMLTLTNCSKQIDEPSPEINQLYRQMLDYSQHISDVVLSTPLTKSGSSYSDPDIDLSLYDGLEEKVKEYVEPFIDIDNIQSCDELFLINKLFWDDRFSDEEKDTVARIIGVGNYVKGIEDDIDTRSPADDCNNAYHQANSRAKRNFVILMAVALFEPTVAAETAAVTYLVIAIDDASVDYQNCIAAL